MSDIAPEQIFDVDHIPEDATVSNSQTTFTPIPEDTYQVEIKEAVLKANPFYHEPTEEERKNGQAQSKYQFSFTYIILDEGEYRGRRIWDNTGLAFKPSTKNGKGGPTKLYKIVSRATKTEYDWDGCKTFAEDTKTLYQNLKSKVEGEQIKITTENTTNTSTGKVRTKAVAYGSIKKELESYEKPTETPVNVDDIPEKLPF